MVRFSYDSNRIDWNSSSISTFSWISKNCSRSSSTKIVGINNNSWKSIRYSTKLEVVVFVILTSTYSLTPNNFSRCSTKIAGFSNNGCMCIRYNTKLELVFVVIVVEVEIVVLELIAQFQIIVVEVVVLKIVKMHNNGCLDIVLIKKQ